MNAIDASIDILIGKEGDFTDDSLDSGGATRWGITERVARRHGWEGKMSELPRDLAVTIYRQEYFIKPGFVDVFKVSQNLGYELFDSGVNLGPGIASKWFQRCLNVLNSSGKHWPDLHVDGSVGPASLRALDACLSARGAQGELVLLRMLNCLQGQRYIELAETRSKDERFIFGWFLHRVVI